MNLEIGIIVEDFGIEIGNRKKVFEVKDICLGTIKNKYFTPVTGNYVYDELALFKKNFEDEQAYILNGNQILDENDNLFEYIDEIRKKIEDNECFAVCTRNGLELVEDEYLVETIKEELGLEVEDEESEFDEYYNSVKKIINVKDKEVREILKIVYKNYKLSKSGLYDEQIMDLKDNILINGDNELLEWILAIVANELGMGIYSLEITSMLSNIDNEKNIIDVIENLHEEGSSNGYILVLKNLEKLVDLSLYPKDDLVKIQEALNHLLKAHYVGDYSLQDVTIVCLTNNYDIKSLKVNNSMNKIVSQFGTVLSIDKLNKEEYKSILTLSEESLLNTYKEFFEDDLCVELVSTNAFIEEISEEAYKLDRGLTGLKLVLRNRINEIIMNAYSYDCDKITLKPVKQKIK